MRRPPLPRRPTSPRSAPLRPERCPALRGPLPRTAGPSSPRPAPAALSGPHSRRTDNPRNAPGPGQAAQVRTAPGATTAGQPARGRPARTSQAARPADLSRGKLQGRGAKVSPPSARRPRAPAAAAPRRNYAIRSRRAPSPPAGSSGNRAGWAARWRGPRGLSPPRSLTAERTVRLGVPASCEYPHRAEPGAPALPPARAGTGRAPQQSARGGKGLRPP